MLFYFIKNKIFTKWIIIKGKTLILESKEHLNSNESIKEPIIVVVRNRNKTDEEQ